MSLATRCPACGTIFRVVQDQLKVSEGWVRCGRCAEVFNASEALVDLQPSAAAGPGGGTGWGSDGVAGTGASSPARRVSTEAAVHAGTAETDESSEALDVPSAEHAGATTAGFGPGTHREGGAGGAGAEDPASSLPGTALLRFPSAGDDVDTERPPATGGDAASGLARVSAAPAGPAAPEAFTPAGPAAGSEPKAAGPAPFGSDVAAAPRPSFSGQPAHSARPQQPGTRRALGAASAALVLLLAAQAAVIWRDTAVAHQPALRPAFEALCAVAGCRIELPRRVDALSVQSSGLLQLEGTALYKLSVEVRNRATIGVRAPAVDLTLTDAQGRIVSRRVLAAADLGVATGGVPAGGELALQAVLATGGVPVAGYSVELFYP